MGHSAGRGVFLPSLCGVPGPECYKASPQEEKLDDFKAVFLSPWSSVRVPWDSCRNVRKWFSIIHAYFHARHFALTVDSLFISGLPQMIGAANGLLDRLACTGWAWGRPHRPHCVHAPGPNNISFCSCSHRAQGGKRRGWELAFLCCQVFKRWGRGSLTQPILCYREKKEELPRAFMAGNWSWPTALTAHVQAMYCGRAKYLKCSDFRRQPICSVS